MKAHLIFRRLHNSVWLRLEVAATLALLILTVGQTVSAVIGQRALSEKLIRLHIVAQSDSEEDQTLKLAVRDRLTTEWFGAQPTLQNAEEAAAYFVQHLDEIAATAEAELRSHGCELPVRVTLEQETFPTRHYDAFALPAGTYTSLRVIIGEGQGKNWWCVMFPPLCTADAIRVRQSAETCFSNGEWHLMTAQTPDVTVKFKLLEWWSYLKKQWQKR